MKLTFISKDIKKFMEFTGRHNIPFIKNIFHWAIFLSNWLFGIYSVHLINSYKSVWKYRSGIHWSWNPGSMKPIEIYYFSLLFSVFSLKSMSMASVVFNDSPLLWAQTLVVIKSREMSEINIHVLAAEGKEKEIEAELKQRPNRLNEKNWVS